MEFVYALIEQNQLDFNNITAIPHLSLLGTLYSKPYAAAGDDNSRESRSPFTPVQNGTSPSPLPLQKPLDSSSVVFDTVAPDQNGLPRSEFDSPSAFNVKPSGLLVEFDSESQGSLEHKEIPTHKESSSSEAIHSDQALILERHIKDDIVTQELTQEQPEPTVMTSEPLGFQGHQEPPTPPRSPRQIAFADHDKQVWIFWHFFLFAFYLGHLFDLPS